MVKLIVAIMKPDKVEPYRTWGSKIPKVIESSHPKLKVGMRLDYGFLQMVLQEGYEVRLIQEEDAHG